MPGVQSVSLSGVSGPARVLDRNDRSMLQRLQHAFLGVACVALLVGIAGCSPTDTKRMQALLDQISHGPEDQLGTFIYGYSDASPGAQQVLMGMIRPLRAPSADKHMTYGKR